MSLLSDAFGAGAVQIVPAVADWREATQQAGAGLVASGVATDQYTEAMIAAIDEYGPYMVIAPGLAVVHARPSEAVKHTGMALALVQEPVVFGSKHNDPVHAVFALAALDHDRHLELLAAFMAVAGQAGFVNSLLSCADEAQIRSLL